MGQAVSYLPTMEIKKTPLKLSFFGISAILCAGFLFTSKSGLTLMLPLLILASFWQVLTKKSEVLKDPFILALLALYLLGLITNSLSLGGLSSTYQVISGWYYPLLVLPGLLIFKDIVIRKWVIRFLVAGGLIGIGYSFYQFGSLHQFQFDGRTRIGGFWDISRWGVFMGFAGLGSLSFVMFHLEQKNWKSMRFWFFLFLLILMSFILANNRAPFLALSVSLILFGALKPRSLWLLVPVAVFSSLVLWSQPSFRNRIQSITQVEKNEDGLVTSKDRSNEGRLHMWQVAIQFFKQQPWFGVGFKNTEKPLRAYLSQYPELSNRYVTSEFSFNDQHSSYLNILIERGVLFFALFWGVLFWAFCRVVKVWWYSREMWPLFLMLLFVYHGVIFVFYTSVISYEMTAFFPFVALSKKPDLDGHEMS